MIEKKTDITIERCLREYARLAFLDIEKIFNADGSLKPISEIDEDSRRAIAGIDVSSQKIDDKEFAKIFKIRMSDKRAALDSIMKHLGGFDADNRIEIKLSKKEKTAAVNRVAKLLKNSE